MNYPLYYILTSILGLCMGSFINALVWRTHEKLELLKDCHSVCPACRSNIAWYDLIPLLSFLILGGKCRRCGAKISWQYPLAELGMGLLFLAAAVFANSFTFLTVINWWILGFLVFIFLYDLKYGEILDSATLLPAAVLFFLFGLLGLADWQDMLFGAAFGAGWFLFLYIISKGVWIGGGDIRLGFFMGIILGWPYILVAFFVAYIIGAFISLILMALKKKNMKSRTAFGTYLVFGTVITMFWGKQITEWYLGLIT